MGPTLVQKGTMDPRIFDGDQNLCDDRPFSEHTGADHMKIRPI